MVGNKLETMGGGGPGKAVLTEKEPPTLTRLYPYCAIDSLTAGIRLVRKPGVRIIDESMLIKSRVTTDEIPKLYGALRFLNLIDKDNNLTSSAFLLQSNKKLFSSRLLVIVEQTYGQEPIRIAQESSNARSDLISYFMKKNGDKEPMAERSSRVFLELLRMGDVEWPGMPKHRQRRPKTHRRNNKIPPKSAYTIEELIKMPGGELLAWARENNALLTVPSSHILTMEMIMAMTEDELTEWFKLRLQQSE